MNNDLKQLVRENAVGYNDLFKALAMLCVDDIRDITEDMLGDIGAKEYIGQTGDLSVEHLTEVAIDFGQITVPEMMADEIPADFVRKDKETWIDFVIRYYVTKHVKDNMSFQLKLS